MVKVTSGSKSKKSDKKTVESEQTTTEKLAESVAPAESVMQEVTVDTVTDDHLMQEESNTEILFNKLINQFQDIQSVMKTLHSNLKVLQKEVLRERKESKKKESKIKKKSDKKRSPSGFAKPAPITPELANFLSVEHNVQLARTDVTSKVISYIKEHNLQNPLNKKEIIPDADLSKLLQPGEKDIITFFNLQTYLKKHFIPTTVVPSTTEPSVTVV